MKKKTLPTPPRADEESPQQLIAADPVTQEERFFNSRVIRDLEAFKRMSDVIVTNRYADDLADVKHKLYTRDLYYRD